jgi:hypothetical protein
MDAAKVRMNERLRSVASSPDMPHLEDRADNTPQRLWETQRSVSLFG